MSVPTVYVDPPGEGRLAVGPWMRLTDEEVEALLEAASLTPLERAFNNSTGNLDDYIDMENHG